MSSESEEIDQLNNVLFLQMFVYIYLQYITVP